MLVLALDTPLTTSVSGYRIDTLTIDFETNTVIALIDQVGPDGKEVGHNEWRLKITDDFGNFIAPSQWPETNPTAEQMYTLLQRFILMGLQDWPVGNGLGPGVIA